MLNNRVGQHYKNLSRSQQISVVQKQVLVRQYLQNPFSISWPKLTILLHGDQKI